MHRVRNCLLLLFCLSLLGCASTSVDNEFGMASNNQTMNLRPGERLTVTLGANVRNDADWHIVKLDQSVVKMVRAHPPKALVATGGLAHLYEFKFDFKAETRGETTLYMEQTATDTEGPVQTFTMHFVVE